MNKNIGHLLDGMEIELEKQDQRETVQMQTMLGVHTDDPNSLYICVPHATKKDKRKGRTNQLNSMLSWINLARVDPTNRLYFTDTEKQTVLSLLTSRKTVIASHRKASDKHETILEKGRVIPPDYSIENELREYQEITLHGVYESAQEHHHIKVRLQIDKITSHSFHEFGLINPFNEFVEDCIGQEINLDEHQGVIENIFTSFQHYEGTLRKKSVTLRQITSDQPLTLDQMRESYVVAYTTKTGTTKGISIAKFCQGVADFSGRELAEIYQGVKCHLRTREITIHGSRYSIEDSIPGQPSIVHGKFFTKAM